VRLGHRGGKRAPQVAEDLLQVSRLGAHRLHLLTHARGFVLRALRPGGFERSAGFGVGRAEFVKVNEAGG